MRTKQSNGYADVWVDTITLTSLPSVSLFQEGVTPVDGRGTGSGSSVENFNDIVGNGISGMLHKVYGKGWGPRWFVLLDGVGIVSEDLKANPKGHSSIGPNLLDISMKQGLCMDNDIGNACYFEVEVLFGLLKTLIGVCIVLQLACARVIWEVRLL